MQHLKYIIIASQLIISFAVTLVICAFLGIYLDKIFHSSPFGLLVGGFTGIAAGFAAMIYLAKRIEKL